MSWVPCSAKQRMFLIRLIDSSSRAIFFLLRKLLNHFVHVLLPLHARTKLTVQVMNLLNRATDLLISLFAGLFGRKEIATARDYDYAQGNQFTGGVTALE